MFSVAAFLDWMRGGWRWSHRRKQFSTAIQIGQPLRVGSRASLMREPFCDDNFRLRGRRVGGFIRQTNCKRSPFSFGALNGDSATLHFGKFLYQGQPDASALVLAAR